MIVRPGRLLPSVIAGALVTGLLALGAGTASAAEDGDPCYVLLRQGVVRGDDCVTSEGDLIAPLVEAVLGRPPAAADPSTPAPAPDGVVPRVVDGVGDTVTGVGEAVTGTGSTGGSAGSGPAEEPGSSAGPAVAGETATGTDRGEPAPGVRAVGGGAAPASSGLPAPDVRGALAPAVSAPGGLLTGVPVLSFGRPNPGLFAPLGSPLRTLTGVAPGPPVTTSSDVQAMAFDGLPGGPGIPAVTGVVILSVLGALALRHRVFRRTRGATSSD